MTKLLKDLPAARKASAEAQAKVKAENAKHTPGPWTHEGQGDITGIENDPGNGCVGPVDVCSVYLRTVPGRHDANARLIAAAPEMLAALQGVVEHWTSQFERRGHTAPEWCKKARAAIAKAQGAPHE